jgi:hypothetical protein
MEAWRCGGYAWGGGGWPGSSAWSVRCAAETALTAGDRAMEPRSTSYDPVSFSSAGFKSLLEALGTREKECCEGR